MTSRACRLISLFFLIALPLAAQTNVDELQRVLRQSPFVFLGTVRQSGVTNMEGVPPSPSNAVIRVERVLLAPERLGDFTGRDITVALLKAGSPGVGQRTVFFTSGWIYGRTLAVREVSHDDSAERDTDALRSAIGEAQRRNREQDLAALLAKAEVVVAGTVVRIEPVPREKFRLPLTEHDPQLRLAVVKVEAALKGNIPRNGLVPFLFANSGDVLWLQSPKLKEGERAVWILSRHEKRGLELDAITAFDPRDVQPPSELDLIRRLLSNQR
jgi:hypothetical protein